MEVVTAATYNSCSLCVSKEKVDHKIYFFWLAHSKHLYTDIDFQFDCVCYLAVLQTQQCSGSAFTVNVLIIYSVAAVTQLVQYTLLNGLLFFLLFSLSAFKLKPNGVLLAIYFDVATLSLLPVFFFFAYCRFIWAVEV